MRIVTAVELDAKMTLVVGEHSTIDPTIAMAQISIARSLKRIADALEKSSPIEEVQPPDIVASYMKANGLICVRRKC